MMRIIFIFFILVSLFAEANTTKSTLSSNTRLVTTELNSDEQIADQEHVTDNVATQNDVTIESVKFMVRCLSIMVTCISILVVVVTGFIMVQVQTKLKSFKTTIEELKEDLNDIEIMKKNQEKHEFFMDMANQNLYSSAVQIINLMPNANQAKEFLKKIEHNYELTKLCIMSNSPKMNKSKNEALMFLKQQGKQEDIQVLAFVAEHDSDSEIRKSARETIGIIKANYKGSKIETKCVGGFKWIIKQIKRIASNDN